MNKDKIKKAILTPLIAVSVFAGGATGIAALASAQTPTDATNTVTTNTADAQNKYPMGMHGKGFGRSHGVMGTVSAVSGNTVTVTNVDGTSYTIDASNAKVSKMVDLNVSDIKVGDTVGVQGTVSGTSVTATHIMDGIPQAPKIQ